MWKKVLYFGIAIVFGILIYIMGYSSNQMNHLEGIVNKAIANEEYYKVPMVWGGCFDTKSIVENNSDKLDIMVYPATSQTDITYGDKENPSSFLKFEKAYYIYIFNAKFSVDSATDGTSSFNKTAIEFSSSEENSVPYNYYFIANETINSNVYVKEPKTKEEVLLNNAREVTNTNSTWNFMRITFTETMLNEISKEMKGKITKLSVKDCDGSVVYTTNVDLNFSQSFFENAKIKDILAKYNAYLDAYTAADGDKAALKELNKTWGIQFEEWKKEFNDDAPNTGYAMGYEKEIISPSKLVWQTIGMLALYALVILLFYVLLFHFSAIKRLFSKENYKDYSRDSKIIVNGKAVSRTKEKQTKEIEKEVVIEPDTLVDETLETVTAGEIIAAPVIEDTEHKTEPIQDETDNTIVEESIQAEVVDATIEEPVNVNLVEEHTQETPIVEPTEDTKTTEIETIEEIPEEVKDSEVKKTIKKPAVKKTSTNSSKKSTTTKKTTTKKNSKTKTDGE